MKKEIIKVIEQICEDVLAAVYQPFWAAVLLAFLFMYVYLYGKEHGWQKRELLRRMFGTWMEEFKRSVLFRRLFFLAFYTALILFRTFLNRTIWYDPLEKLFGGWGFQGSRRMTAEAIENIMLFIPFSVLFLWMSDAEKEQFSNRQAMRRAVWKTTGIVALFSLVIESGQLLFHLGTFQIADLCYNTLGGLIGSALYYIVRTAKKKDLA